jgi:hypothetical protein
MIWMLLKKLLQKINNSFIKNIRYRKINFFFSDELISRVREV